MPASWNGAPAIVLSSSKGSAVPLLNNAIAAVRTLMGSVSMSLVRCFEMSCGSPEPHLIIALLVGTGNRTRHSLSDSREAYQTRSPHLQQTLTILRTAFGSSPFDVGAFFDLSRWLLSPDPPIQRSMIAPVGGFTCFSYSPFGFPVPIQSAVSVVCRFRFGVPPSQARHLPAFYLLLTYP